MICDSWLVSAPHNIWPSDCSWDAVIVEGLAWESTVRYLVNNAFFYIIKINIHCYWIVIKLNFYSVNYISSSKYDLILYSLRYLHLIRVWLGELFQSHIRLVSSQCSNGRNNFYDATRIALNSQIVETYEERNRRSIFEEFWITTQKYEECNRTRIVRKCSVTSR